MKPALVHRLGTQSAPQLPAANDPYIFLQQHLSGTEPTALQQEYREFQALTVEGYTETTLAKVNALFIKRFGEIAQLPKVAGNEQTQLGIVQSLYAAACQLPLREQLQYALAQLSIETLSVLVQRSVNSDRSAIKECLKQQLAPLHWNHIAPIVDAFFAQSDRHNLTPSFAIGMVLSDLIRLQTVQLQHAPPAVCFFTHPLIAPAHEDQSGTVNAPGAFITRIDALLNQYYPSEEQMHIQWRDARETLLKNKEQPALPADPKARYEAYHSIAQTYTEKLNGIDFEKIDASNGAEKGILDTFFANFFAITKQWVTGRSPKSLPHESFFIFISDALTAYRQSVALKHTAQENHTAARYNCSLHLGVPDGDAEHADGTALWNDPNLRFASVAKALQGIVHGCAFEDVWSVLERPWTHYLEEHPDKLEGYTPATATHFYKNLIWDFDTQTLSITGAYNLLATIWGVRSTETPLETLFDDFFALQEKTPFQEAYTIETLEMAQKLLNSDLRFSGCIAEHLWEAPQLLEWLEGKNLTLAQKIELFEGMGCPLYDQKIFESVDPWKKNIPAFYRFFQPVEAHYAANLYDSKTCSHSHPTEELLNSIQFTHYVYTKKHPENTNWVAILKEQTTKNNNVKIYNEKLAKFLLNQSPYFLYNIAPELLNSKKFLYEILTLDRYKYSADPWGLLAKDFENAFILQCKDGLRGPSGLPQSLEGVFSWSMVQFLLEKNTRFLFFVKNPLWYDPQFLKWMFEQECMHNRAMVQQVIHAIDLYQWVDICQKSKENEAVQLWIQHIPILYALLPNSTILQKESFMGCEEFLTDAILEKMLAIHGISIENDETKRKFFHIFRRFDEWSNLEENMCDIFLQLDLGFAAFLPILTDPESGPKIFEKFITTHAQKKPQEVQRRFVELQGFSISLCSKLDMKKVLKRNIIKERSRECLNLSTKSAFFISMNEFENEEFQQFLIENYGDKEKITDVDVAAAIFSFLFTVFIPRSQKKIAKLINAIDESIYNKMEFWETIFQSIQCDGTILIVDRLLSICRRHECIKEKIKNPEIAKFLIEENRLRILGTINDSDFYYNEKTVHELPIDHFSLFHRDLFNNPTFMSWFFEFLKNTKKESAERYLACIEKNTIDNREVIELFAESGISHSFITTLKKTDTVKEIVREVVDRLVEKPHPSIHLLYHFFSLFQQNADVEFIDENSKIAKCISLDPAFLAFVPDQLWQSEAFVAFVLSLDIEQESKLDPTLLQKLFPNEKTYTTRFFIPYAKIQIVDLEARERLAEKDPFLVLYNKKFRFFEDRELDAFFHTLFQRNTDVEFIDENSKIAKWISLDPALLAFVPDHFWQSEAFVTFVLSLDFEKESKLDPALFNTLFPHATTRTAHSFIPYAKIQIVDLEARKRLVEEDPFIFLCSKTFQLFEEKELFEVLLKQDLDKKSKITGESIKNYLIKLSSDINVDKDLSKTKTIKDVETAKYFLNMDPFFIRFIIDIDIFKNTDFKVFFLTMDRQKPSVILSGRDFNYFQLEVSTDNALALTEHTLAEAEAIVRKDISLLPEIYLEEESAPFLNTLLELNWTIQKSAPPYNCQDTFEAKQRAQRQKKLLIALARQTNSITMLSRFVEKEPALLQYLSGRYFMQKDFLLFLAGKLQKKSPITGATLLDILIEKYKTLPKEYKISHLPIAIQFVRRNRKAERLLSSTVRASRSFKLWKAWRLFTSFIKKLFQPVRRFVHTLLQKVKRALPSPHTAHAVGE